MAIKRCRESFTAWVGGAPRVVTAGQLLDAEDPIIKGRERLFEDVEVHVANRAERAARVEQATAEPGEKRARRVPVRAQKKEEGKP